jgi:hypothetical protein
MIKDCPIINSRRRRVLWELFGMRFGSFLELAIQIGISGMKFRLFQVKKEGALLRPSKIF